MRGHKEDKTMKIEHLQYFITLADSSSISKAADKLFISQQQLNRIITALEDDIEAKLLTRTTNGVSLTEDGQDFLVYAKNIVSEYAAMKNHFFLRRLRNELDSSVQAAECRVFLPPCLSMYASDISHNLKNIAPNLHLIIYEKTTVLNEGYFDQDALCFWASEIEDGDLITADQHVLHTINLGKCQIYFAYNKRLNPANKPFRGKNAFLTISFLNNQVLSPAAENIKLVSSNVYQLLDYVTQNNDICVLPDFVLPKVTTLYPDVAFIPLQSMHSPLSVVYLETHTLSESDQLIINFVKSYIENMQLLAKQLT